MERVSSRVVYENPWMVVREDQVRLADGSSGIYGVVEKPDFAIVLPRAASGFWMVEQLRYPVGRRAWEFPQGGWPPGGTRGTPEELAVAELAEETGLHAAELTHLGHLYSAYGSSDQGFDVFLATQLTEGTPRREATEADMVHRLVRDDELPGLIAQGEMVDAASLAALVLYRNQNAPTHDPNAVRRARC